MYDIIVIGGGPAGVTAALRARELGATVALVEQGNLGGTCTNDGCVPTRVLAKAARLVRDAEQFADYGLVGASPAVDFGRLLERTQAVIYQMHEKKQLLANLDASGVTVLAGQGTAHFVDPHTLKVGEQLLQAEKFILCAGGRARRLDFPGEELALTHSDIWRLRKLPISAIIVGGAATGCQLASILASFGVQVTIMDVAPRIVASEDELVSSTLTDAFRRRGIQIMTGIDGVERIEDLGTMRTLFYRFDGGLHTLSAEMILLSTGWLGNLSGVNLPAAGVETERTYVRVDDYLRTSAPHIYAAGDITGRMMLVQSASYEARIAAENAVLGGFTTYRHEIVPHGGFTDPEYGSVGPTEAVARKTGDVAVATVPYAELDRAVVDGHTDGFCKLIVDRATQQFVGVHVVGEQALEIVHVVAAGMASGMTVQQLANLEIAYPTFTAVLGLAARRIMSDAGVVNVSPQWRVLGRFEGAEWERQAG